MHYCFNHTAVCSTDLKKSEAFYQDFLGLKKVPGWCGVADDGSYAWDFYWDETKTMMLEVKCVFGTEKIVHGGCGVDEHLAFATENVPETIAKARSLGYGATDPDVNGNCFLTDPDGYTIEILDEAALED